MRPDHKFGGPPFDEGTPISTRRSGIAPSAPRVPAAAPPFTMNDSTPSSSVLDLSVITGLKELGGDDEPGLFMELVDIFLEDSAKQLAHLEQALSKRDVKTLERVAHTLKSSCANLGAVEMSRLCFEMEKRGRAATFEGVPELLKNTTVAYTEVCRELLRLRA